MLCAIFSTIESTTCDAARSQNSVNTMRSCFTPDVACRFTAFTVPPTVKHLVRYVIHTRSLGPRLFHNREDFMLFLYFLDNFFIYYLLLRSNIFHVALRITKMYSIKCLLLWPHLFSIFLNNAFCLGSIPHE